MWVEYRIIYFYKKRDASFQKKNTGWLLKRRQRKWFGNVSFLEKEVSGTEEEAPVKIFFCGIPAYYGNHIGQLYRLLQNCCVHVSADTYYLEEGFEKELAESEKAFSLGRQRMCGGMIRKLSGQFRGIDNILYLAGETDEQEQGELPLREDLLRKLHCFFYMGEKSERYDVLEENLWREYGMPLLSVRSACELEECRMKRLLVLDDRQSGAAECSALPGGCIYLDLWSNQERQMQIAENAGGIKYLSEYLYLTENLDTLGENRYNTLD